MYSSSPDEYFLCTLGKIFLSFRGGGGGGGSTFRGAINSVFSSMTASPKWLW